LSEREGGKLAIEEEEIKKGKRRGRDTGKLIKPSRLLQAVLTKTDHGLATGVYYCTREQAGSTITTVNGNRKIVTAVPFQNHTIQQARGR
jgi:hypothetical protein